MNQITTEIRKGTIDNIDVEFTVTAKFNGIHVCGAEGHFFSPENAYQLFIGTHKTLIDIATNNTYEIFVADHHFSFTDYKRIDQLVRRIRASNPPFRSDIASRAQ
jgi:hypothetical protein